MFLIELGVVPGRSSAELETDRGDALRMELAQVLRRSENEFVGVGSGLLDQFSSLFGRDGCALFLDCRTLEFDRLPLGQPGPAIVVCDSKTSRRLADGMYDRGAPNASGWSPRFGTISPMATRSSFRVLTLSQLESKWEHLDPVGRKRARHVLSENERVRQGPRALKSGDTDAFGRLMSASHASSRDDFENSSAALDALIEVAASAPGFLGGKLSGAGWAGCTVNLVRAECAAEFSGLSPRATWKRTGITPEIHICRAADGAFARHRAPAAVRVSRVRLAGTEHQLVRSRIRGWIARRPALADGFRRAARQLSGFILASAPVAGRDPWLGLGVLSLSLGSGLGFRGS